MGYRSNDVRHDREQTRINDTFQTFHDRVSEWEYEEAALEYRFKQIYDRIRDLEDKVAE